jgi:hypothetical protein
MKREMKYNIRKTTEFKEFIKKHYANHFSCVLIAKLVTAEFGFNVSGEYVAKVLKAQGIELRYFGGKTRSIYDTQLGRN